MWRVLLSVFICIFIVGVNQTAAQKNGVLDAYLNYDEHPRFPGCESVSEYLEDIEECAELRLIQYLYANVSIPESAREKGVQGTISAKFKVDEKGQISEVTIMKGIGDGCDEALKAKLESMPTWVPGRNKGKPAAAEFMVHFKVKL